MKKIVKVFLLMTLLAIFIVGNSFALIMGRNIANISREIQFSLSDFVSIGASTSEVVSSTSVPGLELDNSIPSLVWADGETTKVGVTFQVPTQFSNHSISFDLLCDQSTAASTTAYVDYEIFINRDGDDWDTSATNNTPIALTLQAATPQVVTLTPAAAEIANVVAGDWITLSVWRDDTTGTGTSDLELYGVSFVYEADQ